MDWGLVGMLLASATGLAVAGAAGVLACRRWGQRGGHGDGPLVSYEAVPLTHGWFLLTVTAVAGAAGCRLVNIVVVKPDSARLAGIGKFRVFETDGSSGIRAPSLADLESMRRWKTIDLRMPGLGRSGSHVRVKELVVYAPSVARAADGTLTFKAVGRLGRRAGRLFNSISDVQVGREIAVFPAPHEDEPAIVGRPAFPVRREYQATGGAQA